MLDQIYRIFDVIMSDGMTFFFCVLILAWLVTALVAVPFAKSSRFIQSLISITPNGLATLGVLGTFTGILIGLLDFNVEQIDESVPELLSGLKIAFTTSIVGMAAALAFRVFKSLVPVGPASESVTAGHLYEVLQEMRDVSKRSDERLECLRKAISDDGNQSLVGQVRELRLTVQDGDKALVTEFKSFAEHMVENNQKAIIEALEEVIKDFNEKLTEQFGENFRELNKAVTGLVEWQDQYRVHVETLEERHQAAVTAIESVRNAVEVIQSKCERIPEAIEPLGDVLEAMDTQTEVLEAKLEALAALRDRAVEAFPVIEENLDKLTTRMKEAVDGVVTRSEEALRAGEASQAEIQAGLKSYIDGATKARATFTEELDSAMRQMSERTFRTFEEHDAHMREAAREAGKSIQESWAQSQKKMEEHYGEFDEAMQQELNRALELLGKNLASLSEKFVEDYTPLTERLQKVVAMAERAA